MIHLFKLAALILLSANYLVNIRVKAHELKRDDNTFITYYLERNNSDVLLLILQGSDCNSVAHIPLIKSHLKDVWPDADLLTIEKYGIDANLVYQTESIRGDCPKPYLQYDSPEQRVNDAIRVLNKVRQQYSYRKVIVLGGSEGAVIATVLSSKLDNLSATVAFNGGGRWFLDDVLHSIEAEAKTPTEALENKTDFKAFADSLRSGEDTQMGTTDHGYGWWKSVLALDQQTVLRMTNSPILIIQGQQDRSVSPKHVTEMINTLQNLGKNNIKYLTYPDLDHSLKDNSGHPQIKRVVKDIHLWLEQELDK